MKVHNSKSLLGRRKELRRNATLQEEILWRELRNNKLGFRFRRQHSVGGYILDFYCFSRRLIVEVDGEIHDFNKEYDQVRDTYFKQLGYQIIRIKNEDLKNDLLGVLRRITLSLRLGEGGVAG